jgi:hypothetical protein
VLDRGRLARDSSLPGLLGDGARAGAGEPGGGGALEALGLLPPPVASLSAALTLPGRPIRAADAARALARVAGGESRHLD